MKIGSFDTSNLPTPAVSERKADNPTPAVASGAKNADASARVELSATAAAMARPGVDDGSFDQAKVDRISQAIRDGQFKVNPEAIADKLIANAQDLLGKVGN